MHNSIDKWLKADSNWLWICSFAITIIFSVVVFLTDLVYIPSNPDSIYYLLSSIGQSLSAILALVFSITLVAAQFTVRYTYRLINRILDRWTVFCIVVFIIGIIYPYVLLARNQSLVEIKISICIMVLCMILLLPYFLTFPSRLGVQRIIDQLSNNAAAYINSRFKRTYNKRGKTAAKAAGNKLTSNKQGLVIGHASALQNIAISALSYHDYDTYDYAVTAMSNVVAKTDTIKQMDITFVKIITEKLNNIYSSVIPDIQAATVPIECVAKIAMTAINSEIGFPKPGHMADNLSFVYPCWALAQMGEEASQKHIDELVRTVSSKYTELAAECYSQGKNGIDDIAAEIIVSYADMANSAYLNGQIQIVFQAVADLIEIWAIGHNTNKLQQGVEISIFDFLSQVEKGQGSEFVEQRFEWCVGQLDSKFLPKTTYAKKDVAELRRRYVEWLETQNPQINPADAVN